MSPLPEQEARIEIDRMLSAAGWLVQDVKRVNLHAGQGVAIREFPLEKGFGFADYLKPVRFFSGLETLTTIRSTWI